MTEHDGSVDERSADDRIEGDLTQRADQDAPEVEPPERAEDDAPDVQPPERAVGTAAEDELIAGRYRLVERVGSGSMGVVWRAGDERLDRTVAVKRLLPTAGLDEAAAHEATQRAMREARITARLHHPHAVTVHDVVEHAGQPCLIMEYLPSRGLSAVLAERAPLAPVDAARIGRQVAEALATAHAAGIVHRDVKPDNVLVTAEGSAKITDFGISRTVGDGRLTGPGIVVGTPAYLAPEVAGGVTADFASDVFSLGAMLYEAVQGAPPFGYDEGENTIALLIRVAKAEIPPPDRAGPLTALLMGMLDREPTRRPAMADVARALGEVTEGKVPRLPVTPTMWMPAAAPAPPPVPVPRRRGGWIALGAVVLLGVGVVAGVLISAGGRGTPQAGDTGTHQAAPPVARSSTDPTSSAPAAGCVARYSVTNAWPGGYQALVTVTNSGGNALDGWTVNWDLPAGQRIDNLWNGVLSQQGAAVTVMDSGYNAMVAANGSTTFGFIGVGGTARPTLHCQATQ